MFQFTGADPAQQDLLVEGNDKVGLIAAVGDVTGADPDAVAAGSLDAACRGLDFGWNDFDRPDAVALAGGDCGERLAAFLRPFSRIADDFDNMFVQCPDVFFHRSGSAVAVFVGQQIGL